MTRTVPQASATLRPREPDPVIGAPRHPLRTSNRPHRAPLSDPKSLIQNRSTIFSPTSSSVSSPRSLRHSPTSQSAPAIAYRRASATLCQKLASLFAMNLDHQSTNSTLRQIPSCSITKNLHPEHVTRKNKKTSGTKQPLGLINNTN
jgi:hypothetical protein